MSFLFIGKGTYTEKTLIDKLIELGFSDPSAVVKEATERKIAVRGRHKIMAVIA